MNAFLRRVLGTFLRHARQIPRLETANSILTREIDFAKATLERVADETAAASAVRATNNEEFTRAREDHQQARRGLPRRTARCFVPVSTVRRVCHTQYIKSESETE